jgi:hypothetical protein
MFDPKSRYAPVETYEVTDARGRKVRVVGVPPRPTTGSIGTHVRKQGQRLDHLCYRYLDDPAGYWRIAELNDAMSAEQLTEAPELEIPEKG